jgi:hypothetical protein
MPNTCSAIYGDVLLHHLRLFGLPKSASMDLEVFVAPEAASLGSARAAIAQGKCVIALTPGEDFSSAFGVHAMPSRHRSPVFLTAGNGKQLRRLRSLHPVTTLRGSSGEALLRDEAGEAVWWWIPETRGGVLLMGTDLGRDLIRYRQGDPSKIASGADCNMWGYAGERPNYLFDSQRIGEPRHVRHADDWAWFFAKQLADRTQMKLDPILPGNAPGAIVITGDDDQASLDCYGEQLEILSDTPVTYFLHPKTKHSKETLVSMLGKPSIDLGLHPDALDAPEKYEDLLAKQVSWYVSLTGNSPRSVRNHGFLNRGYWGHLEGWIKHGIELSSNLPGVDGNVLNGSLLPARVAREDVLTTHWSLLNLIGDGAVFLNDRNDEQAGQCVADAVSRIRQSDIPGVMVLNLHPENIKRTKGMHRAAQAAIKDGFVGWTMNECLQWFKRRDEAHC